MPLDEPFPLHSVSVPVRRAILDQFKGRCPSIQEVAQIPDAHWLATPAIGPASLKRIHSILDGRRWQTDISSPPRLSDAQLLTRLEWLQEELRLLEQQLKARLSEASRRKPNRQWLNIATQDETGRQKAPHS